LFRLRQLDRKRFPDSMPEPLRQVPAGGRDRPPSHTDALPAPDRRLHVVADGKLAMKLLHDSRSGDLRMTGTLIESAIQMAKVEASERFRARANAEAPCRIFNKVEGCLRPVVAGVKGPGSPTTMAVRSADVRSRSGAPAATEAAPALMRIFADGGCSEPKLRERRWQAGLFEDPIKVAGQPRDTIGLRNSSPWIGRGADGPSLGRGRAAVSGC